ncbi:hypothetical protein IAE22_35965, partial [Bacillus sp. S34]|nr:hypothetical protein [Bacillus sp. S34]
VIMMTKGLESVGGVDGYRGESQIGVHDAWDLQVVPDGCGEEREEVRRVTALEIGTVAAVPFLEDLSEQVLS